MPAKKKAVKKLTRRLSRKAVVVDGIPLSEMTKEQLEEHVMRLREELEREREERNFFQVEQDKVSSFWTIGRAELDKKAAHICLLQKEIGQMQEQHQKEIASFKQKTKHLQYEHQLKASELRCQSQVHSKVRDRERDHRELEHSEENLKLRSQLKEQEIMHLAQMRDLRIKHSKELSSAIHELDEKLRLAELSYDHRLREIREESEALRSSEVMEVEERKSEQLEEVRRCQKEALDKLKSYYNDVTQNNMALINSMKEQLQVLTSKNEQNQRKMLKLTEENQILKEPLKEAQARLASANLKLTNQERSQNALTRCQQKLQLVNKEARALKLENEVLLQRCDKLEKERSSLYENFTSSIHEVRQQCELKASLLEKKAQDLEELLNKLQP